MIDIDKIETDYIGIPRDMDYDLVVGHSGSRSPLVAFCDEHCVISSEQYSYYGKWRGWHHEKVTPEEYLIRKLKGK